MAKRSKLVSALDEAAHEPAVRAMASAVAAGGALAAGKVVRDRVTERGRRKRRRYRLQPGESPRQGLGRVARGQLDLTIGLLQRRGGGPDGEAVHEARKALKRLRALLRVSRDSLGDERYRHENVILRDAGRSLSGARDARVLLDTLDDLNKRFSDEIPDGAWSRLRAALSAEARAASEGDHDSAGNLVSALSDARTRVASWPLPQKGGPESLAPGFERIYRRGRRALRAASAERSTENLHELRKRAKDLWHAAQLLRPASPKRMKKLGRRAHRLADLLGDDHDLAVLLDRAHAQPELLDPSELELLAALVGRRREPLQGEAFRRAARLYRRKPRKFTHRLALS
jgi:CHAD domain-containing protein